MPGRAARVPGERVRGKHGGARERNTARPIPLPTHLARCSGFLSMFLLTHGSGVPSDPKRGTGHDRWRSNPALPGARLPRERGAIATRLGFATLPVLCWWSATNDRRRGDGVGLPHHGPGQPEAPTDQRQGSAASLKLDSETSVCSPAATIRADGTVNWKQDQGRRNSDHERMGQAAYVRRQVKEPE